MIVLGLGMNALHDPSAALVIDGEVIAAADEERFCRVKHAPGHRPIESARFCLEHAGIAAEDIDVVAVPWSPRPYQEHRLRYFLETLVRRPSRAVRVLRQGKRGIPRRLGSVDAVLRELGTRTDDVELDWVEHHLAHASSAYHLSGMTEAAILTVDGFGEITTTMFGVGRGRSIQKRHEILKPDSLGILYSAITDYLGFSPQDGEFKTMGMASYGDAHAIDLSRLVRATPSGFRCDERYVPWTRRGRWQGTHYYSKALLDWLGPARVGDDLDPRYSDIAAGVQRILEETVLRLVDHHLGDELERHGNLAYAGGCALNVTLNQKLIAHPKVDRLWVQPAAGDSGLSLGAATFATAARDIDLQPQRHAALGPAYGEDEIERAVRDAARESGMEFSIVDDPAETAAELLADGQPLAWFQGRMEWGPRSLGQRSILGHPGVAGTRDAINEIIKFREQWRPFCPSILAERGRDLLVEDHDSPFMTFALTVRPEWRERIGEVTHIDGTARPQFVYREDLPLYHSLIAAFARRTGLPCVLNTSLNRRGEPVVCRPVEALTLLIETGLEHLVIGCCHVRKR